MSWKSALAFFCDTRCIALWEMVWLLLISIFSAAGMPQHGFEQGHWELPFEDYSRNSRCYKVFSHIKF